ncbi:MAG: GxxExxY protein [Phycisphaerae bacterium]
MTDIRTTTRASSLPPDWSHVALTERIIGVALQVIQELGAGFVESVYEKAMMIALADEGLTAERQLPVSVFFRGREVGPFKADILVEGKVVLELKATKALTRGDQAIVINYLKATGFEVGLLINFGRPRLEFRRLHHPAPKKTSS